MKNVLPKIIIFFIGAGIGAAITYLSINSSLRTPSQTTNSNPYPKLKASGFEQYFDRAFDHSFFNQGNDPFKEMEKMRQRMRDLFDHDRFDDGFDQWYGTRFGGKLGEINTKEDKDFYVYEVSIEGIDPDTLKLEVEQGLFKVQGTYRLENEQIQMSSKFMRTFPLPDNINTSAMSSKVEDKKLVVKFPKFYGVSI